MDWFLIGLLIGSLAWNVFLMWRVRQLTAPRILWPEEKDDVKQYRERGM